MINEKRSYQSLKNNAQGHFFEQQIERACNYYREKNIANIHKVPEPFRVLKKLPAGRFQGQFLKKAEPDFKKDKISKSVLSENQEVELERNYKLGAITAVCICFAEGIIERYFFIPYLAWYKMKVAIGKKSVSIKDIQQFEVQFDGRNGILFLDNILQKNII